jgi:hypothetical protein
VNEADIKAVREPIPNMGKVYAVLDRIEADPEHWDQGKWSQIKECGTAMCFAGWACKLEGLTLAIEQQPVTNRFAENELANGDEIEATAVRILGITWDEAYELFVETLSYGEDDDRDETEAQRRARHLRNIKREVQRIAARAKEQRAAFERIARELIESVPELEDVLKPGYLCPESRDLVMKYLGGQDGGK